MGEKTLADLRHVRRGLPNGGEVHILNRGAVITAEDEAMIQALHSRSTGGFKHHLGRLGRTGSGKFMDTAYVGYGHGSIGDCGDTTAFLDGVSMLAAKAIQDFPLYSGQESSTRYIYYGDQVFVDPTSSDAGRAVHEQQRMFYKLATELTKAQLLDRFPKPDETPERKYRTAINARTYDIARGLLPAGAHTNVAWHGNLRQMRDRLLWLRHHPLGEVRTVARALHEALDEEHPHSFGQERYPETEAYQDVIVESYFHHDPDLQGGVVIDYSGIDREELGRHKRLLEVRPRKTELPKFVGQAGIVRAEFGLDFASWRDVQRHRALNQRMPLLTTDLGFNGFFTDLLPQEVQERLPEHLGTLEERIRQLGIAPEQAQYFVPMGQNVANKISGDIPGMAYMVELRSGKDVHPTLREVATSIGDSMATELGMAMHLDRRQEEFSIDRGGHDIIIKKKDE